MFDVEGARKAGYNDAEIASYMAAQANFDLAKAKKSGYSDPEVISYLSSQPAKAVIPGEKVRTKEPDAPETFTDKALGAGEATLTAATGATGGALGAAGGFLKGAAGSVADGTFGTPAGVRQAQQGAESGAQALTYAPRTQAGQRYAQNMGETLQQVLPIAPLAGELGLVGAASRNVGNATVPAVQSAAQAVQKGAQAATDRVFRRAPVPEGARPTPGTMTSGGSAAVDMATQRQQIAQNLPVPLKLTEGQKTRNQDQLRFEQESAKGTMGQPLRDRYSEQNKQILDNFDVWMDQTGASAPSLRAAGVAVDDALVKQAARDKAAYRVAYKNAEKAGELEAPVSLVSLVDYLNQAAPEAATAPLLATVRQLAVRQGIANEQGGRLVPSAARPADSLMNRPAVSGVNLKTAETLRQAINRNTDLEPTNIRQATIMKGLIDEATEGAGGELYRQARGMRSRYAQNYENRSTIAKLLDEKRGTNDRAVALEDVFQHTVLKSSLDDVRNVRRVLHRAGDDGQQAWKELQGQTMNWLKDEATKGVATDQTGNRIISPAQLNKAIRILDEDGKLDFIFGKKGAEQVREINDLVKVVYTTPPGTVNTSNTASVLLAALTEAGVSGSMTGLPIPILTGLKVMTTHVKNQRLRTRINQALGEAEKQAKTPIKPKRVLH